MSHIIPEYELDHDDPDAVNKAELWKEPEAKAIPNVDLEFEVMIDHDS